MLELPTEISSDGREIWDWAARVAKYDGLIRQERHLLNQIHATANKCGSCTKWMTRECGREVHDNKTGRWKGPHMNEHICRQFTISSHATTLSDTWTAELVDVRAKLKQFETR